MWPRLHAEQAEGQTGFCGAEQPEEGNSELTDTLGGQTDQFE